MHSTDPQTAVYFLPTVDKETTCRHLAPACGSVWKASQFELTAADWWSDSSASAPDHSSSSSDESTSAQACRWDLGEYTHHGNDSSDEANRKSWQPTAAMKQRAAKLYEQRVSELQAFSNQRKLDTAPTSTVSASSANLRQAHAGIDECFKKWFSILQLKTYAYDRSRGDKSFWDTHSGTLRKKSRELFKPCCASQLFIWATPGACK